MLINGTHTTPFVRIDEGYICMEGRSIPEDARDFYDPVLEEISRYADRLPAETRVDIGFEYINTSSTRMLFEILRLLEEYADRGCKLQVTWRYEYGDDDMLELGEIFESLLGCSFQFVETEDPSLD